MKTHRKTPWTAAGLLLFGLLACSPSNPGEEGYEALQSQDYQRAADQLWKAMEGAEPGTNDHREFAVGHFQALAHLSPKECRTGLLAMIEAKTIEPTQRDLETVASELMQVKAFSEAAYVIDVGIKTFPDNPRLPEFMDKLLTMSKQDGQAELASTLKGIGYSGGD